jgi:hypothetical protein
LSQLQEGKVKVDRKAVGFFSFLRSKKWWIAWMLLCAKARKGSDPFSVIKCFRDKIYAIQVNDLISLESFYKSPVFF